MGLRALALLAGIVVLASAVLGACANRASAAPACINSEEPQSDSYDAATSNDAAFNRDFRHCFTTVDGVQMHYVVGGTGPQTLVLLHGWPQSWYEFRGVMPELLPGRTVIAVDLPGMGDSTGQPPAYTKTTLASYVHTLLTKLGETDVRIGAHDFGVGVAYALAAQYREHVAGLFLMDFPLVGKNLTFDAVRPLLALLLQSAGAARRRPCRRASRDVSELLLRAQPDLWIGAINCGATYSGFSRLARRVHPGVFASAGAARRVRALPDLGTGRDREQASPRRPLDHPGPVTHSGWVLRRHAPAAARRGARSHRY